MNSPERRKQRRARKAHNIHMKKRRGKTNEMKGGTPFANEQH